GLPGGGPARGAGASAARSAARRRERPRGQGRVEVHAPPVPRPDRGAAPGAAQRLARPPPPRRPDRPARLAAGVAGRGERQSRCGPQPSAAVHDGRLARRPAAPLNVHAPAASPGLPVQRNTSPARTRTSAVRAIIATISARRAILSSSARWKASPTVRTTIRHSPVSTSGTLISGTAPPYTAGRGGIGSAVSTISGAFQLRCTALAPGASGGKAIVAAQSAPTDRKSTRLNSSHVKISYAVFCL